MSTPADGGMPLPDLENDGMDVVPGPNAGMDGGDARRRLQGRRPTSSRSSTCPSMSRPCSAAPRMDVGELLKLGPGTVLELDRKVGEAIDIYVNDRLVARGEVVLVEDRLGVTMTEIIKAER
jgi:flagellar motor switch protein FliN/FliY